MTGRTRYGGLLHDASRHVHAASVAIERDQFPGRAAAEQAVTAWRDLLHALNRHGWHLFGSEVRVTGLHATGNAGPQDVAALRLVDELAAVGRRSDADSPSCATPAAASWTAAAMSVRAASDLLATHRDVDGAWRSPYAQILDDPEVRAVGFAELNGLVVPVAEAATRLGQRVGQAGLPLRDAARLVPRTESLLDAAMEGRRLGNASDRRSPFTSLEVARPAVRVGDSIVELGDRLARLHRVAWQLTREPHVGIGTLADFASAGVFVHEQASRFLRTLARSQPGASQLLDNHTQAGAAWRLIHLHIRQLRTTARPMLGVRGDVLAIRHLRKHFEATADQEQPHARARNLESIILGGARACTDVARWNAEVLDRLAGTGQLYVPGRLLSGDEVTNDPWLVEAKLMGRITPAAKERIEPMQAAYRSAQRGLTRNAEAVAFLQTDTLRPVAPGPR